MAIEGSTRCGLRGIVAAAVVLAVCGGCWAQVIDVGPESGSLAKALREAKPGETLRLAPGIYEGSIKVPAGVSLEGAGAESTTIVGTDGTVMRFGTAWPDDIGRRVVGLTVMGAKSQMNGIEASGSIRIERCRFVGFSTGVELSESPLSDIVCSDFVNCSFGIQLRGASPTIWGCEIIGGHKGVWATKGEPYLRNNVFWDQSVGYSQSGGRSGLVCQAIVRNNLFFESKVSGIDMLFFEPPSPFIHRNIFNSCEVAVHASRTVLDGLRYCMVDPGLRNRFRDGDKEEVVRVGTDGNVEGRVGASLMDGMLAYMYPKVAVVGPREGQPLTIVYGPEPEWTGFGTHGTGKVPPIRFGVAQPIVNSTMEEDDFARHRGLKVLKRVRETSRGRHVDRLTCTKDGEESELVFDISRILEEEAKP